MWGWEQHKCLFITFINQTICPMAIPIYRGLFPDHHTQFHYIYIRELQHTLYNIDLVVYLSQLCIRSLWKPKTNCQHMSAHISLPPKPRETPWQPTCFARTTLPLQTSLRETRSGQTDLTRGKLVRRYTCMMFGESHSFFLTQHIKWYISVKIDEKWKQIHVKHDHENKLNGGQGQNKIGGV